MAELIPAQEAPYGVNVEAGEDYRWCACGRSASQPFSCTSLHKSVGLAPQKFSATETKQIWLRTQIERQQAILRRVAQENMMLRQG